MRGSEFEQRFTPIFASDEKLATEFKDAMGLQADASMVD